MVEEETYQRAGASRPIRLGLKTLVEPPSPAVSSSPPLNIVFVHGLGGSADDTWIDPGSGSFWPQWLPENKVLENARVMTFGYDSDWNKIWNPGNVLDISDFAKQLANEMWLHYSQYGDVRPLLWNVARSRYKQFLLHIVWVDLSSKRYQNIEKTFHSLRL